MIKKLNKKIAGIAKFLTNKKNAVPLALIFVCMIFIIFESAILFHKGKPSNSSEVKKYAQQVIKECAKKDYHPGCYDKVIPKLMDSISMEEAFQVASEVQNQDPTYGYCHVLGHELSSRETAKDPNNWKEVVHRCPQGVCSNGCLHGAAQQRFRGDILNDEQLDVAEKELVGVCDSTKTWDPTALEIAECFHGLGHLTMYITGADIPRSLDICNKIAVDNKMNSFNSLCYEGAFMQLFQPLDADDEALIKDKGPNKKEELAGFCKQFGSSDRAEACWREGFNMYRKEVETAKGTVNYCNNDIVKDKNHCYLMLYYTNAQGTNYDAVKLSNYCDALPAALKPDCFGNVANAIIHGGNRLIDSAVSFCGYAKEEDTRAGCYKIILDFSTYNLSAGSDAFIKLCNDLPEPFRTKCLEKKTSK